MSDTISLRDQLAMSAPEDVLCNCSRIMDRPMPESGTLEYDLWWAEAHVRKRYIWADLALRVRAETMPKVEPNNLNHIAFAKWGFRDDRHMAFASEGEPILTDNGWIGYGRFIHLVNNSSIVPDLSEWRESKVRL